MPDIGPIETERLVLREWRDDDLAAFRALNADARVMAFFPGTLNAERSDALAERIRRRMAACGFGLWAVEVKGVADFIGFVGLTQPAFEAHFTPCVEIGWRLAFAFWGQGYAREAAREAAAFGFKVLGLAEIVSFSVPANTRSRAVMANLGMTHDPADDFDHPNLPVDHELRRHVLYRLRAGDLAVDDISLKAAAMGIQRD